MILYDLPQKVNLTEYVVFLLIIPWREAQQINIYSFFKKNHVIFSFYKSFWMEQVIIAAKNFNKLNQEQLINIKI